MSTGTVRIDGHLGQRVTFEVGRLAVTISRGDGKPAGYRKFDDTHAWLHAGFVAGKVHVEFIDSGIRIEDYSYRVSWDPKLQAEVRREMLKAAVRFLGVKHLPWSRTHEDKRSPHQIVNVRPHYLKARRILRLENLRRSDEP